MEFQVGVGHATSDPIFNTQQKAEADYRAEYRKMVANIHRLALSAADQVRETAASSQRQCLD